MSIQLNSFMFTRPPVVAHGNNSPLMIEILFDEYLFFIAFPEYYATGRDLAGKSGKAQSVKQTSWWSSICGLSTNTTINSIQSHEDQMFYFVFLYSTNIFLFLFFHKHSYL